MENGKYEYDIKFHSQLGLKIGKCVWLINDNDAIGFLHIFGKSNKFSGIVTDDDTFTIQGTVSTLVRNFDFVGTGKISENEIEFEIIDGSNVLKLIGKKTEVVSK